jgi:hypothetical protein
MQQKDEPGGALDISDCSFAQKFQQRICVAGLRPGLRIGFVIGTHIHFEGPVEKTILASNFLSHLLNGYGITGMKLGLAALSWVESDERSHTPCPVDDPEIYDLIVGIVLNTGHANRLTLDFRLPDGKSPYLTTQKDIAGTRTDLVVIQGVHLAFVHIANVLHRIPYASLVDDEDKFVARMATKYSDPRFPC